MIRSTLVAWPTRRLIAALVLVPIVGSWFLAVGRSGQVVAPGPGWYALILVAAVLGAAVLASYVPGSGLRLDLGCSPCAAMSALTVVGASMALRNYGTDVAGPLVAGAVLLFGLTQRWGQPATCAVPTDRHAGG